MNVYVLSTSDTDRFWLDLPAGVPKPDWRTYAGADLNESSVARARVLSAWKPLEFATYSKRGKASARNFRDVHAFSLFKGLGQVVSDRCREIFEREMPGTCTFLPLSVQGAPHGYWGLWVNTVIDAIDPERSDLAQIVGSFVDVGRRTYLTDRIGDCPIFRLPMRYATEWDQVTDRFKEVIERHELTNFSFWDRTKPGKAIE